MIIFRFEDHLSDTVDSSPFLQESFPQDNVRRVITSVGPLFRKKQISAEPYWNVSLRDRASGDITSVEVPSGHIMNMRVGSVWNGSFMFHPTSEKNATDEISVDCSSQQLLTRVQNEADTPTFVPYGHHSASGPPYVMVPIDAPKENWNLVLVRCSELFRVLFGHCVPLARYAFDFGGDAQNEHLYHWSRSGTRSDGTINFAPATYLTAKDAKFIAAMLYLPASRKALIQLSVSARTCVLNGKDVWPTMLAPMEGKSRWNMFGAPNEGQFLDPRGQFKKQRFYGCSQLLGFDFSVSIPTIHLEETGVERPRLTDGPRSSYVQQSSRTSQFPHSLSGAAPGNRASQTEAAAVGLGAFNGLVFGDLKKKVRKGYQPRSSLVVRPDDDKEIQRFSGLTGGTGDEDTGHYRVTSPIAAGNVKKEKAEPTESLRMLPSIPHIMECPTDKGKIPRKFDVLLTAIADVMFRQALQNATFSLGNREPVSSGYERAVLFKLPETWGAKALCKANDDEGRRVLWVDVTSPSGRIIILDIEGRYATESVGAQIYGFPARNVGLVDDELVSQLLHSKVIGKGWPNADDFVEDFFSVALNHAKSEVMFKRVENKMIFATSILSGA